MSLVNDRIQLVNKYYTGATINTCVREDFDRVLKLVIPGDPVSDGRPRENKKLQIFYNAKKEFLRKIFKHIYAMDPILQKLCIITPHRIEIRAYSMPTSKESKFLTEAELNFENVYSIGNKDNDNVEKVNWDILQDTEFMIILNDSATVNNETFKYYSFTPRTEIYIYFSTRFTTELYKHKIECSMEYKYFLCSKKYLCDIQRKDDASIIEYLALKLIDIKSTAAKKMKYLLSSYSAIIIDGLFKAFFFSNTKSEFIDKYIKKKNKVFKITMLVQVTTGSIKSRDKIIKGIRDDEIYKNIIGESIPDNE